MDKKLNYFFSLVILFIAASYCGYMIEQIFSYFRAGYIEAKSSLIFTRLNVIYGAGATLLTMFLNKQQTKSIIKIFIIAMLVTSLAEYISSWGEELFFGTVSWDYHHKPFNLHGRICLEYSLYWGLLGIFWAKVFVPFFNKYLNGANFLEYKIIMEVIVAFLISIMFLSGYAGYRLVQRRKNIKPTNYLSHWMDKHFNDLKMQKIYSNSRKVNK